MKVLHAGPDYQMEMGWMLQWQAKVRAMSRNYDKTVVIANEFGIYKDFAEDARTAFIGNKSMWKVMNPNIDYIQPCREICCNATFPQEFYRYEEWKGKNSNLILIHARFREVGGNRNWGRKKWIWLIRKLNKRGFRVGSIGTDIHELNVDENYNNCNFSVLCKAIASSKMLIGPSSGPMHLASIIGTPHVVWTDDRKWNLGGRSGTNRQRYESAWNPFGTTVTVIDKHGWDVEPEIVLDEIGKI